MPLVQDGTALKQAVINVACDLIELPAEDSQVTKHREAMLRPVIDHLASGVFRLVVMGEIKKGKSSFVNSMLGHDVLPTGNEIATSVVFKLLYGTEERYTVFFLPKTDDPHSAPPPLDIAKDAVRDYGTEVGNPRNEKNVAFISIEIPSALLKTGLVIIDTPGVGGLYRRHRAVTFEYAPNADGIIFAVDSVEAMIGSTEVKFLHDLVRITKHITFVQTKTDAADLTQVDAYRKRNLTILSQLLDTPSASIPYFLVSAHLKRQAAETGDQDDLADSGYIELMQYMNHVLIPSRDFILAGAAAEAMMPDVTREHALVVDLLQLANETRKDKLDQATAELTEAQRVLEDWTKRFNRGRLAEFHDELRALEIQFAEQIDAQIGPDGELFHTAMAQLSRADSADDAYHEGLDIQHDLVAECTFAARDIFDEHAAQFNATFKRVGDESMNSLQADINRQFEVRSDDVTRVSPSFFESASRGYIGGSVGRKIGGIIGGIASTVGAFFGHSGLGHVVGKGIQAVSSVFGAVTGSRRVNEGSMRAQINNFEREFNKITQRAVKVAKSIVTKQHAQMRTQAEHDLNDFAEQTKAEIEKRLNAAKASGRRTHEESAAECKRLEHRLSTLNDMKATLTRAAGAMHAEAVK